VSATVRLATANAGKAAELARLLGRPVEPVDGWEPPPEDGATFLDNARIKARAGALRQPGAWILADDSGLEVDALGGAPGVLSARLGGPDLDDLGRCERLLELLAGRDDRAARFRCVLVALAPDGRELVGEGSLEGRIADAPRGAGGFGYDPVFVPDGLERTCAELAPDEKDAISHRARAAAALRRLIED
jgi:XTP/dITP diphosphohydrolase